MDVTIESVGGQGDGIAKVSSFVIFVKGASKGETCKVKISEVKRTYAIGEKIGNSSAPAESSAEEPKEEAPEQNEEPAEESEESSEEQTEEDSGEEQEEDDSEEKKEE